MNIQLIILLFAFVAMPGMAASPVHHSELKAVDRTDVLQKLQRGSSFTHQNQTYQYLPEVRAVRLKSGSESLPQALQRAGVAADQIIETKGQYALYRGTQRATAQTEQNEGHANYPAVLNVRTQVIGILPGTIEVKPKNMSAVAAIAAQYGLSVLREFSHLGVVYYQVSPGQDIFALAHALAADARVSSSEIEILEHLAVPK
ncbi:MAG: hypothetical protein Q7S51_07705 [Gallionellaceae bacterium]|nr:hypothetical protein [Gallionellaceae bacterium]